MEDSSIVALFNRRDDRAIAETASKYGSYCGAIAGNILSSPEDTEEILNDTWLSAWNDIPPTQPSCLRAYLGRITRNLALSRYRFFHTKKRYTEMELLLSELSDCLPSGDSPELALARAELTRLLSEWLETLQAEERQLFVRRYWYGVSVKQLAREAGITQNAMTQRLLRTRRSLRILLEQEGVEL